MDTPFCHVGPTTVGLPQATMTHLAGYTSERIAGAGFSGGMAVAFETPPRWSIVIAYLITIITGATAATCTTSIWWHVGGWLVAAYGFFCFVVTMSWGRFIPTRRR